MSIEYSKSPQEALAWVLRGEAEKLTDLSYFLVCSQYQRQQMKIVDRLERLANRLERDSIVLVKDVPGQMRLFITPGDASDGNVV